MDPLQTPTPRQSILIVDDEPTYLGVLREILAPHYQVRAATNGADALRIAARDPQPDLILLDIVMPGLDGFAVLSALRSAKATAEIPVIFVSAVQDEEDEQRGFSEGAVDYIHKPIRSVIALSRIRAHLDARAARDMLRTTNRQLKAQVSEGAHALQVAQKQLLRSERLAAIGLLSAGIAHEISNPIGYVYGNLSTLVDDLADLREALAAWASSDAVPGDPAAAAHRAALAKLCTPARLNDLREMVGDALEGTRRVTRIVRSLRDFSNARSDAPALTDLNDRIETTLRLAWNELKYKCTVRRQFGELPPIHCVTGEIDQVLLNLLVNASHAIESTGEIALTTRMAGEDAVQVLVADTGKGMGPEVMAQIFEPFFTTKPEGVGTGLGLPLSLAIVRRHGGKLEVESAPGRGTTFTLTLPIAPCWDARPDGAP